MLDINGMSGRKYRIFINSLISQIEDASYLEIGTWSGSTLCSAVNRNRVRAVAIDNWSHVFEEDSISMVRGRLAENLKSFKTPEAEVTLIDSDFRQVDFSAIGKFKVYLYDGGHDAIDQTEGIKFALPALAKEFVLIVDDWNFPQVRQGTAEGLIGLNVRHNFWIRTSTDDTVRYNGDWHNGYFVAVISV